MKNLFFLLGALVLFCGGCKYFKKQTPQTVEILTADTSSAESTYDSTAYYTEPAVEPVSTPQPVQTTGAVSGRYYMIVGCFKVDENADRYAEKIRAMGYPAEILPAQNDFEMIAARSYSSYRESVSELEKFRTEVTPNAWVYKQK